MSSLLILLSKCGSSFTLHMYDMQISQGAYPKERSFFFVPSYLVTDVKRSYLNSDSWNGLGIPRSQEALQS